MPWLNGFSSRSHDHFNIRISSSIFHHINSFKDRNNFSRCKKACDKKKKKHINTTFFSKLGRVENILNLIKRFCKTKQKDYTKPYRNLHAGYTSMFPFVKISHIWLLTHHVVVKDKEQFYSDKAEHTFYSFFKIFVYQRAPKRLLRTYWGPAIVTAHFINNHR